MPSIASFHAFDEFTKPATQRAYHNNSLCSLGRDVPPATRRPGTGAFRLCEECGRLNSLPRYSLEPYRVMAE